MMLPGALQHQGKLNEERMSYLCGWNYISLPSIIQKIGVHATPTVLGEKT
jgi:hypothetical protein